jgi:hypothetical protein
MESSTRLPPRPDLPSDQGFFADLRAATEVWKRHPFLLLLHLTLWASFVFIRFWPVTIPVALIEVGWPGVERIWYLRAFNGSTIAPYELARLWRAFFWRFALLGLVVFVPFSIVIAAVRFDINSGSQRAIEFAVFIVAIDFALTFVTPALSFTTRRVGEGLRLGLRMIRTEWPRCALYVLAPPLAIQAVIGLRWIAPLGAVGSYAISGVAAVLGLAFKGATAAFFLRRYPCGDDGAAWQERHASPAPPTPPLPGQVQEHAQGRRPNVPEDRMRRSRKRR